MKKAIITFGVLIITLLCSISVFAMDTDDSGMWEYQTYGNGVELTGYNGTQTDVYVPNKITKGEAVYSVLKLGDELFKDNTTLNSATLGEGITKIGASAFEGATNLVCIVTPESLTTIGERAFSGCAKFNSVILKDSVISIADTAFLDCKDITVYCSENSVSYIFSVNNKIDFVILGKVTTPETVTVDGIEYYIQDGEATAISFDNSKTDVVVPAMVKGYPVARIDRVFEKSDIARIVLPNTIKNIENNAFRECKNLKVISLPESVTAIGSCAFMECTELTEFVVPDSVISIGSGAFWGCTNLKSVFLNKSLENMEGCVFYECTNLENIEIPPLIDFIEPSTFYKCTSLKNITLPDTVVSIGSYAFSGCNSLASITIPKSVKSMLISAFPKTTILGVYKDSYAHRQVETSDTLFYITNGSEKPEIVISNGVSYFIKDRKATAITFDNSIKDVVVPSKVDGYPVVDIRTAFEKSDITSVVLSNSITSINAYAFSDCKSLSNVKISDSITFIGTGAFNGCTNLANIIIPDSVEAIGSGAFQGCSNLTNVTISSSVTEIDIDTFESCKSLQNIVIPDSVTLIDHQAFSNCKKLENVILSASTEFIGNNAFHGCTSLEKIVIPKSVKKMECAFTNTILGVYEDTYAHTYALTNMIRYYIVEEGVSSEFVKLDGVTYYIINDAAIAIAFDNSAEDVTIPALVNNYPVTGLNLAFAATDITSITLPETITKIPPKAFFGCSNLISVSLPETLVEINDGAFDRCENLASIVIPKSVTSISISSFPKTMVLIVHKNTPVHMFAEENDLYYTLINSETLEFIKFGGVTYYLTNGEATPLIYDEAIEDVVVPANVNKYPVKSVGTVFKGKKIKSIVLPNTISIIERDAFLNCNNLTRVVLPDSVTNIGVYAFGGCTSLTDINIPESVTTIECGAFSDCTSLTSIYIPDSVTTLAEEMFLRCSSLKSVRLSNKIQTIKLKTFYFCTSLTDIIIPNSVVTIGQEAFVGCTSLANITIPNSVVTIKQEAFRRCEGLTSFVVPNSVKSIGYAVFTNCTNLTNVLIPESVTSVDLSSFEGCESLENVLMPRSVTIMKKSSYLPSTFILCVYANSYAHEFAVESNLLHFVIRENDNPEISYGQGISGVVTYAGGSAASDVTVEILYDDGTVKETVTTDANGNYEFYYAEVGRYTIRATDSDCNTASEVVSVKRMNVFDVYVAGETDFVLKKGYNVSGTVSSSIATIILADTSGNIIKSVDTTDGTFTFTDIPRGSYIVKAESETGSATTEIYVSNEDVTGISIEIQVQSATITGDTKIENRDGTYSAKIWVNIDLIDSDGNVVASTKTDVNGRYTFAKVPAGSYNIVATTNEMRPDLTHGFDKSHELKGYAHVDVTEFAEYTVGTITLRENKVNSTSVSGKVTAKGVTQDCQVILTNENGDQIAVFVTDNNGKYNFINISDGMYCITAITKADGMGFAVITIENGVVYGDTDIEVTKADKISQREQTLLNIPDCNIKEEALIYKEAVMTEKSFYDSLSEKERKQLSEEWIEKLFKLVELISDSSIVATDGVKVENEESILSQDEIENEEKIEFVLSVTETHEAEVGGDGINTAEEYETEKIKDKKGNNKNIAKYYDITFSKDGQNISNIQKQTETNGKLRITMDIPEGFSGHKHYSFIHMHKGEAVTLVDLDDNPNTVTFEIDKFSTFALTYSDVDLVGEVEQTTCPATVSYNNETGKISVSSTETGTLYIATYDGKLMLDVKKYDVVANEYAKEYNFASNQVAFVWDGNLRPLCDKFTINK